MFGWLPAPPAGITPGTPVSILPPAAWYFVAYAWIASFIALVLGRWAFWVLLDLAPVLAMTAFHREAPPAARLPWLLALPAAYLLAEAPMMALQVTGDSAWIPDFSGLYCVLVAAPGRTGSSRSPTTCTTRT